MPGLLKGAILYRKFRYRKGYGVHSPFVYDLITKVIEEKTPYYAFEKIRAIVGVQSFEPQHQNFESQHQYGTLLFRLVNFFKCKLVLHIGSPEGIISLYPASTHSECICTILEEDWTSCLKTKELAKKAGLNNLNVEYADYSEKVEEIFQKEKRFDLIFINIPERDNCPDILNQCISKSRKECVFVVNGIRNNSTMKKLWKNIVQNHQVSVSIDLYSVGIFFLRNNIYKQHYKAYFNHGKEQNIHKNRRQRHHFFSWRKKSL
jgi:predicted O-methyltransferase YrrM